MGPGAGGSPGSRGRAEPQGLGRGLERRPEVSARGRRSTQALPMYLTVGWYVYLCSGAEGPCRAPGKAHLAHLQQSPAPGKQDRGAATRVFLLGLLAAPRAAAILRGRSWEPSKKPAPLPLSPP